MNVVRQLAQAILVLGLLGCVARLLAVAIGNHRVQGDHVAAAEDRPSWICDHDGAHRNFPEVLIEIPHP